MNLMTLRAAVVLLAACSSTAFAGVKDTAAGYPSGPIKIVVPYTPAGSNDLVAEWVSSWIA